MNTPFRGWRARSLAPVIAILAGSIGTTASATVWRCGNSYSDTPCAGATAIEAPASPSAQQQRQADEATRKDQAAAQRMERERIRLEAAAAGRGAVIIGEPPRASRHVHEAATLTPVKKKTSGKARSSSIRSGEFVASGPAPDSSSRKKKKSKAPAGD